MARTKFLPDKSGQYIVEYKNDLGGLRREKIFFDKTKSKWMGAKDDGFYKTEILSWYDARYGVHICG